MMNTSKVSDGMTRQVTASTTSPVSAGSTQVASATDSKGVIDRVRLRELVKEVDPQEQMDDDVEDVRINFQGFKKLTNL